MARAIGHAFRDQFASGGGKGSNIPAQPSAYLGKARSYHDDRQSLLRASMKRGDERRELVFLGSVSRSTRSMRRSSPSSPRVPNRSGDMLQNDRYVVLLAT